jgi:hypothetical protein
MFVSPRLFAITLKNNKKVTKEEKEEKEEKAKKAKKAKKSDGTVQG